jgi:hypothetical protein
MTLGIDPASVAVAGGSTDQALAQFEPDGTWEAGPPDPALEEEIGEDAQWIVWPDAALEAAWAASEVAAEWLAAIRLATTR